MSSHDESKPNTLITKEVAHLIALASAMASNNEQAFQLYYDRLAALQVSKEDMIEAINVALKVKMTPHRNLVELAEHYLVEAKADGGCCGGHCGSDCGSSEDGCSSEGCGDNCHCK